jgi:hypothetical protein
MAASPRRNRRFDLPGAVEVSILSELLGWPPILWTARVLVLILLLGACAGSILYFLRFIRWRSVAIMWNAGLPRIK